MTGRRAGLRRARRALLAGAVRGGGDGPTTTPSSPGPAGYYLRLSHTAMACQFEVYLCPGDRLFLPAVRAAFDEVDRVEAQLTIYRDDSDVARLNRAAAVAPVRVDPGLFTLLSEAQGLGAATGGAFDLTTGALVRCWGFRERQGRVPESGELAAARACSGWQHLALNAGAGTVAFLRPGVELNLGALGKGYALDRAASLLRAEGLASFLMHAGSSSVLASGSGSRGVGWPVSLRDPHALGRSLGMLRLVDQSLSTSGVLEQAFTAGDRRYGHILDPRTGLPAEGVALASVVAPRAAVAEALSTAFVVLGAAAAARYCHAHPGVGSIVVADRRAGDPAAVSTVGIALEAAEVSG